MKSSLKARVGSTLALVGIASIAYSFASGCLRPPRAIERQCQNSGLENQANLSNQSYPYNTANLYYAEQANNRGFAYFGFGVVSSSAGLALYLLSLGKQGNKEREAVHA